MKQILSWFWARWSNKKLIQGEIFNEIFVEHWTTLLPAVALDKDELAIIPMLRKLPDADNLLSDAELTVFLSTQK